MQVFVSIRGLSHSDFFTREHTIPKESLTDATGQTLPQTPHSMQRPLSITWSIFFSPRIASTGHNLRQAPQPLHVSVILYATFTSMNPQCCHALFSRNARSGIPSKLSVVVFNHLFQLDCPSPVRALRLRWSPENPIRWSQRP